MMTDVFLSRCEGAWNLHISDVKDAVIFYITASYTFSRYWRAYNERLF